MMEAMRDLDAIDRQLNELGQPPGDRSALLARVLGADRSRKRLEELLASIGADAPAVTPAPSPALASAPGLAPASAAVSPSDSPPASRDDDPDTEEADPPAAALADGLSHDMFVGRPPAPPDDDEPELSLSAAPSEPPSETPSATPSAHDDRARFAAMFDFTSPPPPRESLDDAPAPTSAQGETYAFDEPQPDEEPTRRRSVPAPPEPIAAADDDSDAEEADFELLVEDEDIIEIDDEEMQIVDDE
jgi:hypothetical protein